MYKKNTINRGIGIFHTYSILRIMKWSTVVLSILFVQVSAYGFAQKITLDKANASLKSVLKEIRQQSGYYFLYTDNMLKNTKPVNIKVKNANLQEVLNQIFIDQSLVYIINENTVTIRDREKKIPATHAIVVAEKIIKGVVVDKDGLPIPRVSVLLKGTTKGTQTNQEGQFSISLEDNESELTISAVGYISQTVTIADQRNIRIILQGGMSQLDEVIVVGYGTQKKENLTGAVAQISGETLSRLPISNIGQGLQGTVANLNISTGSGLPGQGSTYNVRGSTSITAGGGPLILVDGVQMDPNLISPQDVESVTVLKDAASAAIYGARGGYGVILITTKTGKLDDKATVSGSANWGIYQPTTVARTPNSLTWANYINQVALNAGQQPVYNDTYMSYITAYYKDPKNNLPVFYDPAANDPKFLNDPTAWSYAGNTDWYNETINPTSSEERYNLSVQGGTQNTKYYVSQSYNRSGGLMKYYNDSYKRWNTNMKVSSKVNDWLELTGRVMYNYSDQDLPTPGIWGGWGNLFMNYLSPLMPVRHPDGNFSGQGADTNPAAIMSLGGFGRTKKNDAWLTGAMKLTPMKGLTVNADYTFNYFSNDVSNFVKEYYEYRRVPGAEALYPWTTPNSLENKQNNDYYAAFNFYSQYEKSLNKNYFSAMIGYNSESKAYRGFGAQRQGLISNDVPFIGLASGQIFTRNDGSSAWGIEGLFSRINYNYDQKYYIEFNGRYDGTSKFPKGNRFAFFPSISGAWRMTEEAYFKPLKNVLNEFKLRASYGSLGNQAGVSNFGYYPAMGVDTKYGYLMNGQLISKVSAPALVSDHYTWESIRQFDIGVDFAFLQNKLTGSFDWYKRMTLGMLAPSQPFPATLGTTAPNVNSADLNTKGWDMTINWQDKTAGGFNYHAGLVLSDYRGQISRYYNPTGAINTWYNGKHIGDIWGYTTLGLFQTAEEITNSPSQAVIYGGKWMPGDIKLKDLNGDNKITYGNRTLSNHGDLAVIGNTEPRYSYGLKLGGEFKGFDLDVFLQGVGRKDFFPSGNGFWGSSAYYQIPTDWAATHTWTPDHTSGIIPRPSMGNSYNQQTQTGYKYNAGYLRLKNVTLGYTLPKELINKVSMRWARVYFSGQNLFCFSSLPYIYDPETLNYNTYPVQRVFSLGLDIKF